MSSSSLEEEECYTFECHDSIEISPFDKFEVNILLDSVKEEIAESKNVLPNVIYDNALDDGLILPNDIYYTTTVKSGLVTPLFLSLIKIMCLKIMKSMLYVIVILLSLFMMLLKIILREENMVIGIFMLLNFLSL